jgi:hypothetical protein
MATSKVDICNIALTVHLGAQPISAFSDDTKEGLLALTSYDELRDAVLAAHPWNCASKRTSLTALEAAPEWGYTYAYQRPDDGLRILEINGETADWMWQVEDGKILCDFESPIEIRYIYRNETVSRYDPELVMAISYMLAMSWVEPLVKAANLKEVISKLYGAALSSARSTDGQEGSPRKVQASTWLDRR